MTPRLLRPPTTHTPRSVFHDIATIVASKTVNPESGRPYPVAVIERAMSDAHVSVRADKAAKMQALEVIRVLQERIPIERARLRIRVAAPHEVLPFLEAAIAEAVPSAEVERTENSADGLAALIILILPASYRVVEELVTAKLDMGAALTVVDQGVAEGSGTAAAASGASAAAAGDAMIGDALRLRASMEGSVSPDAAAAEAAGMGLSKVYVAGAAAAAAAASGGSSAAAVGAAATGSAGAFACTKCAGAGFATREAYREHFRSDWHRVNLKRGMRKLEPLSEAEWTGLSDEERARAMISEDAAS